ncbi:hypothetical protein FRC14_002310 [Serendipita sp. 396]|nr:hypothetical protein FRC14_002310 [Serendipita sp. 396]KAG8784797.1 hypothetical protein FRC15_002612 [Serendipita sp. 397]KAG8800526.1 hypothetical protein FRC16_002715 [Serendipita sp. 398]KAG8823733.1 hypothetical protein FRC19_003290 [Serendipita sp. 401]KAG8834211.1 hypothetical protein FRC18_002367 [Serendipita sp. 400]KAG8868608.1 hypothetical protein FRC20_003079 [Serendipita sp. 405]KAG9055265.1 hypothetical protein FS842_002693 [Serendipita sp. 407]
MIIRPDLLNRSFSFALFDDNDLNILRRFAMEGLPNIDDHGGGQEDDYCISIPPKLLTLYGRVLVALVSVLSQQDPSSDSVSRGSEQIDIDITSLIDGGDLYQENLSDSNSHKCLFRESELNKLIMEIRALQETLAELGHVSADAGF